MKPSAYPAKNTEELDAISTFEKLLNKKFAKPDIKRLDTRPNTDGTIELVDDEQRPIGKIEIQVRKIPDGKISYQCPIELIAYSENISLPLILICVDVGNNKAYHRHLHRGMTPPLEENQQTFVIKFDPKTDLISSETSYLREWTEITQEYIRRISDFPMLRQIENRLNLSHISKKDRIYFQEFIEHTNQLLDQDFPIVKKQFFNGVWKLGVAVSSTDPEQVCFQIYNILPGDPDIRVSGISEHPQKPSIVPGDAVSVSLQGQPGNKTIQYNWINRSVLKEPSAAAEDIVFKYLIKMLRAKSFPLFGTHLTTEYLFWFVDRYGQSIGTEEADRLNVAQMDYGVFVFLPAWVSIAVPRYLGELVELNRHNLSGIAHAIVAPPFETVACIYPYNLRPTKEEVIQLVDSGQDLNPANVRFREVSPQSLADSLDFLKESNTEWIDRPYKAKSQHRFRIWSGYSVEALRHNIQKVMVGSLEDYRLFVDRNRIPLKNSIYLHQAQTIIYEADLTAWASPENLREAPTFKMHVVKNEDHKLPKLIFVDVSQFPNKLLVEKERLRFDGLEREIIGGGGSLATDLFSDLPMRDRIYRMLTEDLQAQYKTHYFA